ncbi:uncharacterized protein LOC111812120 [Octodon degus]|uniref:Uncharacterized protein LOC111812120 n=1 Tax=Octodon degus TaxID=10160 RepID=A0A6P6D5F2_OCTDE|nr:uncharacterized protein LOC111812120 [Octodon degus]
MGVVPEKMCWPLRRPHTACAHCTPGLVRARRQREPRSQPDMLGAGEDGEAYDRHQRHYRDRGRAHWRLGLKSGRLLLPKLGTHGKQQALPLFPHLIGSQHLTVQSWINPFDGLWIDIKDTAGARVSEDGNGENAHAAARPAQGIRFPDAARKDFIQEEPRMGARGHLPWSFCAGPSLSPLSCGAGGSRPRRPLKVLGRAGL